MIEVFPAPRKPVKTVIGIGVSFDDMLDQNFEKTRRIS
jgi:hypothetical protein